MNRMKRWLTFAAAALALAACARMETEKVPATGDGIPFKATMAAKPATKALEDKDGFIQSSWKVGEKVGLIYLDGEMWDWDTPATITEVDSHGNATLEATLAPGTPDGRDVVLIYPYEASTYVPFNDYLKKNLLLSQEGTLEYIAKSLDVRRGYGVFSIDEYGASFKSPVALSHDFSIRKFTLPFKTGQLVVSTGGVDYTVTPKTATDELYVVLKPMKDNAISYAAKDASGKRYVGYQLEETIYASSYKKRGLSMTPEDKFALSGVFSVAAGKKVQFSPGNLQWFHGGNQHNVSHSEYTKEEISWGPPWDGNWISPKNYNGGVFVFADHQWEICGTNNSWEERDDSEGNSVRFPASRRIDLFVYASSGRNRAGASDAQYHFKPFAVDCYGLYHSPVYGQDGEDLQGTNMKMSDWGQFNAILNGGDAPEMWRVMTRDEWNYLLNQRTGATSKRAFATVMGVRGLLLLPDNWSGPSVKSFDTEIMDDGDPEKPPKTVKPNWSANVYASESDWNKMEQAGAVFLPAAGSFGDWDYNTRSISLQDYNLSDTKAEGSYWTRSSMSYDDARCLRFGNDNWMFHGSKKVMGRSVRLVMDVK